MHVPRRIITETGGGGSGAVYGTGEERIYHIRQALEELGRTLKKLPSLALRINAVTGIDPTVRFSEVGVCLQGGTGCCLVVFLWLFCFVL